MATHDHPHTGHEDHGIPLLPPEPRDTDTGLIVKTSIALILFMLGCVAVVTMQFNLEMGAKPAVDDSVFGAERRLPPEPRLQAFPAQDLHEFRSRQSHVGDTFGWVDKQAGIARVPVDKAIDMVLASGLPVRNAETEKAALAAAAKAAAASAAQTAAGARK